MENWNMGLEMREGCGLEGQKNGVEGTQSRDKPGREPVGHSGVKDRANQKGKRRPRPYANHQIWLKSSNSFSAPDQGTSSSSSCRDRMRNIKFTDEENDLLVSKVLENYSKLYGDDASRTSSFEKKRIWRGILESINCLGVSVRNIDTCKKRFADAKRYVRSKMNRHWGHGGPRSVLNVFYTDWEEKIKAVLCPLGDGFPGIIDSADPSTYESPGYWSPPGNTSPEAQLSPEESVTREMQFYTKTEVSEDQTFQTMDEEFASFKGRTEGDDGTLVMPTEGDVHQNHDRFTSAKNFDERPSPEAQLSPKESVTTEVQFCPKTQVSKDHKFQKVDGELSSFKVCAVGNVKEEDDDGTSVLPTPCHQKQDILTSAQNFAKQPSPEAQLSPEESVTSEVQLYPKREVSEDHNEELSSFKVRPVVNVSEEGNDNTSMKPTVRDIHQSQDRFAPPHNLAEQHSEDEDLSEMDRLLYHGQAAFRRTLRQQLHAVHQELKDFRRDHMERMDLLLTLHRDHIAVEEQRNQILSQLVNTVSMLATKLSPEDMGGDRQCLRSPLTATSTSAAETATFRSNATQHSPSWLSNGPIRNRREKRAMNGVPVDSKKRK